MVFFKECEKSYAMCTVVFELVIEKKLKKLSQSFKACLDQTERLAEDLKTRNESIEGFVQKFVCDD